MKTCRMRMKIRKKFERCLCFAVLCCCYDVTSYLHRYHYKAHVVNPQPRSDNSFGNYFTGLTVVYIASCENEIENNTEINRSRNVRFVAPLLEYGYRPAIEEYENQTLSNKPLLLYLPGFDGTFLSPFLQFPELHTIFDVRCMTVATDDRSTLDELLSDVKQYLEWECVRNTSVSVLENVTDSQNVTTMNTTSTSKRKTNATRTNRRNQQRRRPVYLAGESFGGILASMVAIMLLQEPSSNFTLKGLTVINAATCYDRSKLAIEGPKVTQRNDCMYPIALVGLLSMFSDKYSIDQLLLILQAKALPSVIDNSCREAYMGRVAFSLPFILKFMPKETLRWRLSAWLDTGGALLATADRPLEKLQNLRTLIIAGENDATLPSIAEAERLASILKNSMVHVVEGAGHASTCGSRVDLAALFRLRFEELRPPNTSKDRSNPFLFWQQSQNKSGPELVGRIAMKEDASSGERAYFGMQPRYDNAKIGLNPLRYWSEEYYKKFQPRQSSG